ncbi:hypothetical protein PAXRUDRAFT_826042, partial [Paxillus rubicundulus Ve08.2h10]
MLNLPVIKRPGKPWSKSRSTYFSKLQLLPPSTRKTSPCLVRVDWCRSGRIPGARRRGMV